ncbi:UDP-glucuronosyltransferase 2B20-like [Argonauta hians]
MKLKDYGHVSYVTMPHTVADKFHNINGIRFIIVKEDQNVSEFQEASMKFFSRKREGSWFVLQHIVQNMCDTLLLNDSWFQTLKELNATLAVVDSAFMSVCLAVVPYKLSIPFVFHGLNAGPPVFRRVPWNPAVFPAIIHAYSDRMTYLQRIINTITFYGSFIVSPIVTPSRRIKEYAPEKEDVTFGNVLRMAKLFLTETDLLLSYPKPSLPNEIFIGGVATHPAMPLKGNLKEFTEKSTNGIIVVSFGSMVEDLPKEHLNKLEMAFKEIKYDVIWKHSYLKSSAPNIYMSKWLPQNDLLGHPKTKLFITHCGNNGQFEALYHAVPMLGFPVFAEQFHNGHQVHVKEYGISMNLYDYTKDDLVSNIKEIIDNPKYKSNIKHASDIFHSRLEYPAERGARHIDHIIKYGSDHIMSPCQSMPLYQYFMLDVYIAMLAVIGFVMVFIVFIFRKCFRCCFAKKEKKE